MKAKQIVGQKIICLNRKASFNYFFHELIEAGIVLKGSEVKSLRDGKGSIADSYAVDKNGEIYLINSHIPLYRQSSYNNHDPKGERKLLLNRKEINKLIGRINQEGLTVVPTKMYFIKGKAKIQLAVAKGKKLFDKRLVKKKRDWNREKARILSRAKK
jgi:SsrA-binding protein